MYTRKLKIGVTIGDFNGIGVEVFLKVCIKKKFLDNFILIFLGSKNICKYYIHKLNMSLDLYYSDNIHDISLNKHNVIEIYNDDDDVIITPGTFTFQALKYAFISLRTAVYFLQKGFIDILVTCPMSNKFMYQYDRSNFKNIFYFDHTFNTKSLICLLHKNLKIGLLTNYLPINQVVNFLNLNNIIYHVELLNNSLIKDFDCINPKIAILGFNPSYGNLNFIGDEEFKYIIPSIKILQNKGINIQGPFSVNMLFKFNNYNNFDCVLSIYHDQAMIIFNILTFNEGVKYFIGLPFIITSPNHGVAYDIAGLGIANECFFQEAVFNGIDIYYNRF